MTIAYGQRCPTTQHSTTSGHPSSERSIFSEDLETHVSCESTQAGGIQGRYKTFKKLTYMTFPVLIVLFVHSVELTIFISLISFLTLSSTDIVNSYNVTS